MTEENNSQTDEFSGLLFEKMKQVNPGLADLEFYEFCYALENLTPAEGWESVTPRPAEEIEKQVNDIAFYRSIQIKPVVSNRLGLDNQILELTRSLMAGLVKGAYSIEWVNHHFYFDVRGFYFLHRTLYFTPTVLEKLGGAPLRQFAPRRADFVNMQSIGYRDFKNANAEVDVFLIESIKRLVELKGTPLLIALAGPTAAGKTEIVARLEKAFTNAGKSVSSLEIDNFLTDRDYREQKGIDSRGKEALHFDLFKQCLWDLTRGQRVEIPVYDFFHATSSHDLQGKLKPGCSTKLMQPADIIFMEGNFPFLLPEIAAMVGIKIVYLTNDDIRLKRKWKRDMDYRKKYELAYFLNRYFREQYIMAQEVYIPQMLLSDMAVSTSDANLWASAAVRDLLVHPG